MKSAWLAAPSFYSLNLETPDFSSPLLLLWRFVICSWDDTLANGFRNTRISSFSLTVFGNMLSSFPLAFSCGLNVKCPHMPMCGMLAFQWAMLFWEALRPSEKRGPLLREAWTGVSPCRLGLAWGFSVLLSVSWMPQGKQSFLRSPIMAARLTIQSLCNQPPAFTAPSWAEVLLPSF